MDPDLLSRLIRLEEGLANVRRENEDLGNSFDRLHECVRSCTALNDPTRGHGTGSGEACDMTRSLEIENANLRGRLAEAHACLDGFFRNIQPSDQRSSTPQERRAGGDYPSVALGGSGRAPNEPTSSLPGQDREASVSEVLTKPRAHSHGQPGPTAAQVNLLDKDDDLIEVAAAAASLVQLAGDQSADLVRDDVGTLVRPKQNYIHYFEGAAGGGPGLSDHLEGRVRTTAAALQQRHADFHQNTPAGPDKADGRSRALASLERLYEESRQRLEALSAATLQESFATAERRRHRRRDSPGLMNEHSPCDMVPGGTDLASIRYRPSADESNVFRTVLVTNLPPSLSMKTLLSRIRGGALFSAVLLNTQGFKNWDGSNSALIIFMREDSATEYTEYVSRHGLKFLGRKANVTKLDTPTWPVPPSLLKGCPTRCLTIQSCPRGLSEQDVEFDLAVHRFWKTTIEHIALRATGGSMQVRFTSIGAAVRAFNLLKAKPRYQRLGIYFARDPCSYPLEELAIEEDGGL